MADRRTSFRVIAQGEVTAHGSYRMYKDSRRESVTGDVSSKRRTEPMTPLVVDKVLPPISFGLHSDEAMSRFPDK
ncbi:hypothetical protein EYF80_034524 [Liparis tanakae]|uniref:Uncharacterized protein n=1 Tax=Liparis tanakae TaxID=230148 RepID=A0A4Z2GNN4_9TELE|nr:hypothetical protein EYF80_034524 [Liparis tanakae]